MEKAFVMRQEIARRLQAGGFTRIALDLVGYKKVGNE
jgi:PP-loop superfamily ATP-utilizing enzyme